MGQCTSGELPAGVKDDHDGSGQEGPLSVSESDSQRSPLSVQGKGRRRSSAASWVTSKFSRGRKGKGDLSAAFNLLDYSAKKNLVNINTAPEEELMTLTGVTRSVARSIVEYRTAIGGFRRVEDLVLVSGVGANRLEALRNDVTVKKSSSRSSSRTQSVDSLPSCESGRSQSQRSSVRGSPGKSINVNAASIFDLMAVRGMSQEMAANIVDYRERKGPFRDVEDLVKVRGVNGRVLTFLSTFLSTQDPPPLSPPLSDVTSLASSGRRDPRRGHRRTHSAPLDNDDPPSRVSDNRVSINITADIYELLSLRSERPILSERFEGRHKGRPAIRIATWNLQKLTRDKVANPGVVEVVCCTVLENGFSILAIQEVASRAVLEKICAELNHASLRRVRECGGVRGEWRWQVSDEPTGRMFQGMEYAAFVYNVQHGVQLVSATTLNTTTNNNNNNKSFARKPYLGYFKASNFDFVVVSLHIKAREFGRRRRSRQLCLSETEEVDEREGDNKGDTERNGGENKGDTERNGGEIEGNGVEAERNGGEERVGGERLTNGENKENLANGEEKGRRRKRGNLTNGTTHENATKSGEKETKTRENAKHNEHGSENKNTKEKKIHENTRQNKKTPDKTKENRQENGENPSENIQENGKTSQNKQENIENTPKNIQKTSQDRKRSHEKRRSLDQTEEEISHLSTLVEALQERLKGERDVVLLGDFNLSPDDKAFDVVRAAQYSNVVPAEEYTNITGSNVQGSCCYDNIWLNPHTRRVHTGCWGVVRAGLTHMAIPRGWGWGGPVSDHCPVYADLYADLDLDKGQVKVNGGPMEV